MVARAYTVAFQGVDARLVEVQCATSPGMPGFSIICIIGKPLLEGR
jgi:magnesium chelatase family protein